MYLCNTYGYEIIRIQKWYVCLSDFSFLSFFFYCIVLFFLKTDQSRILNIVLRNAVLYFFYLSQRETFYTEASKKVVIYYRVLHIKISSFGNNEIYNKNGFEYYTGLDNGILPDRRFSNHFVIKNRFWQFYSFLWKFTILIKVVSQDPNCPINV